MRNCLHAPFAAAAPNAKGQCYDSVAQQRMALYLKESFAGGVRTASNPQGRGAFPSAVALTPTFLTV